MKKMSVFLIIIVSIMFISCEGSTKSSPIEDFNYKAVDGEIVITGYKGSDREIYIPDQIDARPVTQIDDKAFSGYDLTLISIPDGVYYIGEDAFYECKCLETIILPNTLTEIDRGAFSYCESLESVDLPDSVTTLKRSAFGYCDKLKELRIPDNCTELEFGRVNVRDNFKSQNSPVGTINNQNSHTIIVVSEGSPAHKILEERSNDDIGVFRTE